MHVLVDADALIKLTKAGAKELVTSAFSISIPMAVFDEIVTEGKQLGFADAVVVDANVQCGRVSIVKTKTTGRGSDYVPATTEGDRAFLHCAHQGNYATVVTDDAVLLRRLKGLGISATVPAALLLAAGRRQRLHAKSVRSFLEALQPYISHDEFATFMLIAEGKYPRK